MRSETEQGPWEIIRNCGPPKDVPVKLLVCYLRDKRDFVGLIKIGILRWRDYPELYRWVPCNHKDLYKKKQEGQQSQERPWEDRIRGRGNVIKEAEVRLLDWEPRHGPFEAEKGKETYFPKKLQKKRSPAVVDFSPMRLILEFQSSRTVRQ